MKFLQNYLHHVNVY